MKIIGVGAFVSTLAAVSAFQLTLDPDDKVKVSFESTGSGPSDEITFTVVAQTTGWVGIGLSPGGGMAGADIIVGWVDSEGMAHIEDRHAEYNSFPPLDSSDDVTLISGYEDSGKTTLKFKRKIDTCDEKDLKVSTDTVRLIYAYGLTDPSDNDFSPRDYHSPGRRGSKSVYLLDPEPAVHSLPEDTLIIDMTATDYKLPSDDTTYYCSFHDAPQLDSKHHIVAAEILITPGNEGVVHHAVLYSCWGKDMEHLRGSDKQNGVCYSAEMPEYAESCKTVTFAWAVGGSKFYFPEEAGYSLGAGDGTSPEFFMLEMHYDNPLRESGREDSSGLRLTYTPSLRTMDMGTFQLGLVHGIALPPHANQFMVTSYCDDQCMTKWIPEEGLTIFAYMLHAHLTGIGIQVDLYRNGKHEEIFARDDHYDFNYQENRLFPESKKLYRGDTLKITCTMDTSDRERPTYGGLPSTKEMCLAFLMYYPRQEMSHCGSVPDYWYSRSGSFYEAFKSESTTGNETLDAELEFEEIFSSIEWNSEKTTRLQRVANNAKHIPYCTKGQESSEADYSQLLTKEDFPDGVPPAQYNYCSEPPESSAAHTAIVGLVGMTLTSVCTSILFM